jgi:hypothetical protein
LGLDLIRPEVCMDLFKRLPGHVRVAPGLEQAIWRRLPAVLAWGSLLPVLVAGLLHWLASDAAAGSGDSSLLLWDFRLIGVVVFHWTLVGTVALGCVIVRVMKGPGYVADAYPRPEWGNDSRRPND